MFTRGLLVAVVFAMVSLSAVAGISPGTGQTTANGGMAFYGGNIPGTHSVGAINNGSASGNLDFDGWCAVVWAEPRWFDLIIVDQYHAGPFNSYSIQVAYSVPDGWVQANGVENWEWVSVERGGATTFTDKCFAFSPGEIAGVRFVRTEYLWHLEDPVNHVMIGYNSAIPASFNRCREIWCFDRYRDNLASRASFTATGIVAPITWSVQPGGAEAPSLLTDLGMLEEIRTNILANGPCIYVDFRDSLEGDEQITIDGFMIAGGTAGEVMGSFTLEYSLNDGTTWETAFTNATTDQYMVLGEFAPITASYWRFCFTGSGDNAGGYARVSEIMMFGVAGEVPEPATMVLLALGGLSLLRRRGR